MRRPTSILVALTFLNLPFLFFRTHAHGTQSSGKLTERETIESAFTLPPGTHVKIFSISGPVEIKTTDSNVARVHVVRNARSREDFARKRFIAEQTATELRIGTEDTNYRNVQINDEVVLELPRQIRMSISSISGPVTAGDVVGPVHASSISGPLTIGKVGDAVKLSSISGPVQVASLTGHLDASSVSGNLFASVDRLDERGIHLNSVSGPVELRFQSELNAELDARSISGRVYLDVPNAPRLQSDNTSDIKVRIGSGGAPISINSVSGPVRIVQK
jgi:DUF4097 and DUF4098 domain-containing protein YvlB